MTCDATIDVRASRADPPAAVSCEKQAGHYDPAADVVDPHENAAAGVTWTP